MKKLIALVLLIMMLTVLVPNVSNASNASIADVTQGLEDIGQPFTKAIYARNVWDMQLFGDKIYLGHGNSSNVGPSTNAGTNGVVYLDTGTGLYVNQYTGIADRQIDKYKVLNNELYIPGHDGETWELGNFYKMHGGIWSKNMTIPDAIHVYDMALFGGQLFAVLGSTNTEKVLTSKDKGQTWSPVDSAVLKDFQPKAMGDRVFTLFELKGKLYAAKYLFNAKTVVNNLLCMEQVQIDGVDTIKCSIVSSNDMLPSAAKNVYYKIVRTCNFKSDLLYIAGEPDNDHQYIPDALYYAADINAASRITLPDSAALPIDILDRGDTAYVLSYVKVSDKEYINIVYSTDDGRSYSELFRFTQDTFARSFEELNGDFYFGLGCDTDILPESTGHILRVKSQLYEGIKAPAATEPKKAANTGNTTGTALEPQAPDSTPVESPEPVILPDTQAPTVPANFACKNVTKTTATVAWSASTDNVKVKNYVIYINGIKRITTDKTQHKVIFWLNPGGVYKFTILARDVNGNTSELSEPLIITTPK